MDKFYEDNKEFMPKRERVETQNKIKVGIMTYAPSVILSLILLAMSGLGSLLQFNFSIKEIVWTTFFISLGLRLVSNFLSKYVGSNLSYNKALYSEEMQKLKKEFVSAGEGVNRDDFDKYIHDYNLTQKKNTYKNKKRTKIQRLKTKINALVFANELECKETRNKKIQKLKKKVSELESISSDEYVDKNIAYIKVKYNKVKSHYFLSPAEDYIEDSVRYRVDFSKENTKEILKSLPLTIALVFFSSLLAYDAIMGKVNAVSVLFDIGNMIFNFIIGWVTVGKKIAFRTMNAYINRQNFIMKFKAYEKETKKTVAMATEECTE